ncbi:MAG: hypothetical protein HY034_01790 [Nitrospirae bacterium]|nr:hypothetical protein [Nitrospirota bacterium]
MSVSLTLTAMAVRHMRIRGLIFPGLRLHRFIDLSVQKAGKGPADE